MLAIGAGNPGGVMTTTSADTRRGFLGGLALLTVGGAASLLAGCAAADGGDPAIPTGELAVEHVPLQPWMQHASTLPTEIPAVRLTTADDRDQSASTEPVSTKI